MVQEALKNFLVDNETETEIELPLTNRVLEITWESGLEDIEHYSNDDVLKCFGITNGKYPYFNERVDKTGEFTRWESGMQEYFNDPNNLVDFAPRPHQGIAALRTTKNWFKGQPIGIFDNVGLGKTLASIVTWALLQYMREYYIENNDFPGIFGEHH